MLFGDMREASATSVKLFEISPACLKGVIAWASSGDIQITMKKVLYTEVLYTAARKNYENVVLDTLNADEETFEAAVTKDTRSTSRGRVPNIIRRFRELHVRTSRG